jgi:hypothetical protein
MLRLQNRSLIGVSARRAPNDLLPPVHRGPRSEEDGKHAKECRGLAKQMESGEQRDQLLKMAETWEVLASERQRTLRNKSGEGDDPPLQAKTKPNGSR